MKDGTVYITALCQQCPLVRERFVPEREEMQNLASLIGAEALAAAGCTHVDAVTVTRKKLPDTEPPGKI